MNDSIPLPPAERACLDAHAHYRAALAALPPGTLPEGLSFGRAVEAARRHPDARAWIAAGDAILWRLILAHDRLVWKWVWSVTRHRAPGMVWSVEDLHSDAQIGLLRGLIRWRRGMGAAPLRYARSWAIVTMQSYPTTAPDMTMERRRTWYRPAATIAHRLDALIDLDSHDSPRFVDRVESPTVSPDAALLTEQLLAAVAALTNPRHADVLRLMLDGVPVGEIGQELGLSHQRVGQIREVALSQIRQAMGVTL